MFNVNSYLHYACLFLYLMHTLAAFASFYNSHEWIMRNAATFITIKNPSIDTNNIFPLPVTLPYEENQNNNTPPTPANLYFIKIIQSTLMPSLTFIVENENIIVRLPLCMIKSFKLNFHNCIEPCLNTINQEKKRQSSNNIQSLAEGYCRTIVTHNTVHFPLDYTYFVKNFLLQWIGTVDSTKCNKLYSQLEKLPRYPSEDNATQQRLLLALRKSSAYF